MHLTESCLKSEPAHNVVFPASLCFTFCTVSSSEEDTEKKIHISTLDLYLLKYSKKPASEAQYS